MFSRFFIERPIFATVISLIIVIAGLVAMKALPVAQYPSITPVQVTVTAVYPGADSKTVADAVAALIDAAGASDRLGVCLDSCHLFASGYDIRTNEGMDAVVDEISAKIGRERIGSLHLNDSQTPLGSNRDRHANIGEGELGEKGCAAFLSTPAFQDLPCVLETPGEHRSGPTREEIKLAMRLRERGLEERKAAR